MSNYVWHSERIRRGTRHGTLIVALPPSVLDDSEAGRKLKGAMQDTSQFMGDKSRAATKVLGQAKNSLFTSLLGGFNQSKQWLAKSPSLPAPRPPPSSDD